MIRLRIDTWDPEYGLSFEAMGTDNGSATLGQIEGNEWTPIKPVVGNPPSRIGFIDGARRVDVRLFAEDSSGIAPALAGSWAVGVAWVDRPPTVEPIRVGRCLVVGGGLRHVDLRVNVGPTELVYVMTSVAGSEAIDPIQGLQNTMRLAEADLANRTFRSVSFALVTLTMSVRLPSGRRSKS